MPAWCYSCHAAARRCLAKVPVTRELLGVLVVSTVCSAAVLWNHYHVDHLLDFAHPDREGSRTFAGPCEHRTEKL